jgi:ATP citrate (pro-S)-lyase
MAQKALREYDGKAMLARLLPTYGVLPTAQPATPQAALSDAAATAAALTMPTRFLQVAQPAGGKGAAGVDFAALAAAAPWVTGTRLVVKPDQLIKRRGKGGLILLNADWPAAVAWISERMGREVTVDGVAGVLTHFIVEPFLPHGAADEYYVCITSTRDGEDVLFHHEVRRGAGAVRGQWSTWRALYRRTLSRWPVL